MTLIKKINRLKNTQNCYDDDICSYLYKSCSGTKSKIDLCQWNKTHGSQIYKYNI